jgi:hypothetical protein
MGAQDGTPSERSSSGPDQPTLFSLERWRETFLGIILWAAAPLALVAAVVSSK